MPMWSSPLPFRGGAARLGGVPPSRSGVGVRPMRCASRTAPTPTPPLKGRGLGGSAMPVGLRRPSFISFPKHHKDQSDHSKNQAPRKSVKPERDGLLCPRQSGLLRHIVAIPEPIIAFKRERPPAHSLDNAQGRDDQSADSDELKNGHSGILSCFFHGFSRLLVLSFRSPSAIRRRVLRGWITSSMNPLLAATNGLAKRSS